MLRKARLAEVENTEPLKEVGRIKRAYFFARKVVVFLERDPLVRFFVALLFVSTFLQLSIDLIDRRDEREFRAEERVYRKQEQISRSWEALTSPSTSNASKVTALEFLFQNGVSFRGIDLSCETLGRGWDESSLTCRRPLVLTGLDLHSPNSLNINYTTGNGSNNLTFAEHWLGGCLASDIGMTEPEFVDATSLNEIDWRSDFFTRRDKMRASRQIGGADFREARLSGVNFFNVNLSGANFSGGDLRGSRFSEAVVEAANFNESNIEGMSVTNSFFMGSTFSDGYGRRWIPGNQSIAERLQRVEFSIRPVFNRVWLDGTVIDFGQRFVNFLRIEQSSLTNAEVNLNTSFSTDQSSICVSGKTGQHDMQTCIEEKSNRVDIEGSDLTCAMIFKDYGLGIIGSNISGARFPNRYVDTGKEHSRTITTGVEPQEENPSGSFMSSKTETTTSWSTFDRESLFSIFGSKDVWAWSDQPPVSNLSGEIILDCDPEDRDSTKSTTPGSRVPSNCEAWDNGLQALAGKRLQHQPPDTFDQFLAEKYGYLDSEYSR